MNVRLAAAPPTCRDCQKETTVPPRLPGVRICGDCRSKYIRTKPTIDVVEVLRLAREFVTKELAAP